MNESKLYREGEVDARIALLRRWRDAGVVLGNHTFSHPSLHKTPLAMFEDDLVKGETATKMILAEKGQRLRWFRHPFLQTGPTKEVKAAFEEFLASRGYRVAPVTIDTNDWMFNSPFTDARERGDEPAAQRVRQAYLDYIVRMLDFYEDLERRLFGRAIRHVLLIHANELNADAIDAWGSRFCFGAIGGRLQPQDLARVHAAVLQQRFAVGGDEHLTAVLGLALHLPQQRWNLPHDGLIERQLRLLQQQQGGTIQQAPHDAQQPQRSV